MTRLRIFVLLSILTITLAVTLAGCATPESAENEGEGSEVANEEGATDELAEEETAAARKAEYEARYDAVEAAVARGDVRGALAIADEVLAREDLDPLWEGRFHVLKIRAKRDLARENILRGIIRLEKYRYTIGEKIRGEVVLENISRETLRIPASAEVRTAEQRGSQQTGTYFHRVVTYCEFVPSNTIITETDVANIRVDQDIELEPGESFRIPMEFDTGSRNLGGTMLRSYNFACTLHPSEIDIGDEVFNVAIEFRSAEARVYPENAEHLADRPLERVHEAYRKRSPIHLHLAASLVPESEHEKLYKFFAEELARPDCHEAMELAIMTSLRITSGLTMTEGKDEWLLWLRTRHL